MAGHSKWANIKHRKGRQDALRGKMNMKLIREITVATKESGDILVKPAFALGYGQSESCQCYERQH